MRSGLLAFALLLLATSCSLDPVRDEDQADLGDEARGVGPGPLHRPGQPCLVCHDGSTASAWSMAGTVYAVRGEDAPLSGASVILTDATLATFTATTNEAGNFYIEPSTWQPTYPVRVSVSLGDFTSTMTTIIGRDGSCAGCHVDPASRVVVGRVYLAPTSDLLPSGGTP
ncbi:MAG: hypothetical protein ACRELY_32935 [Polyangiaceae bacterium]